MISTCNEFLRYLGFKKLFMSVIFSNNQLVQTLRSSQINTKSQQKLRCGNLNVSVICSASSCDSGFFMLPDCSKLSLWRGVFEQIFSHLRRNQVSPPVIIETGPKSLHELNSLYGRHRSYWQGLLLQNKSNAGDNPKVRRISQAHNTIVFT